MFGHKVLRRRIVLTFVFLMFYMVLPTLLSQQEIIGFWQGSPEIAPLQPMWIWMYGIVLLVLTIFVVAFEVYCRSKEE
ncbi:MAG: hypothetical protein RBR24_05480 [Candidatus Carbobacillus sp.]|nr:hypothetical protein [Candidatus Carbobacillus sp.]